MHILTLTKRVELLSPGEGLDPGEYLLDDENASQLMILGRNGKMMPFSELPAKAGGGTLFMRAGGFGDMILLTPVLREHKRLYPDAKIAVSCFPIYAAALEGLPYVDAILPYPLPLDAALRWGRIVLLERAIEMNPRAEEIHATDVYAELCGVDLAGADKRPDYRVKPSEAVWAASTYPRTQKKRVCIQVGASALARRYPLSLIADVAHRLVERDWEVFLLGSPGELPEQRKDYPGLTNLTRAGLSFRQSCAVLNACDVVIAPDSAMTHVAGALEVPCVALYGPFNHELRTAYCPTTFALHGAPAGPGCPCFHHVNQARQNHFPADCPSRAQGFCAVMADIRPERVVAKVEQIARTLPGNTSL